MVFFLIAKLDAPKTPSRDLPEHLVIPPHCFKQYTPTERALSLGKDEKTQVEHNVQVIGVLALGVVYACRGTGTRRGLYIEARTLERKGELCWSIVPTHGRGVGAVAEAVLERALGWAGSSIGVEGYRPFGSSSATFFLALRRR